MAVLIGLMISSSKIYAGWSFVGELEREVSVLYFKSIRHFISVFFDFFFLSPRRLLEMMLLNLMFFYQLKNCHLTYQFYL